MRPSEMLARWLGVEPMDATIRMYRPETPQRPAVLRITGSDRRRIEHYVELLIDKDWIIEEIIHGTDRDIEVEPGAQGHPG